MPRTQCWIRNCVSPRSWCNNQLSLMLFCHAQIIMVWPCLPVRGIPCPPSWVGCLFFWSAVSKFEDCVWCSRNHYFFLSADCVVSIFCDSVRATSRALSQLPHNFWSSNEYSLLMWRFSCSFHGHVDLPQLCLVSNLEWLANFEHVPWLGAHLPLKSWCMIKSSVGLSHINLT